MKLILNQDLTVQVVKLSTGETSTKDLKGGREYKVTKLKHNAGLVNFCLTGGLYVRKLPTKYLQGTN